MIKIFADGADLNQMLSVYKDYPEVKGFTTNPSLMRQAGVSDYEAFAKKVLAAITDLPISFEIFADDFPTMIKQARIINSWADNVYVKIPVMNTEAQFTGEVIKTLADEGVKLNVTALFTPEQTEQVADQLNPNVPAVVSVFAGRVANTGVCPMPLMRECAKILRPYPKAELLWASSREPLNIVQAEETGCHIITVTHAILKAVRGFGKDLNEYSLETVRDFYRDATEACYQL